MLISTSLFLFSVVISNFADERDGATINDVKKLYGDLLKDYNKDILPIYNQSAEFLVETAVGLLFLGELEEKEERLTTTMMMFFTWTDESIVWNRTEYDISFITMDASNMWKPHISVTNAHAGNKLRRDNDWRLIEYSSNGRANWETLKTFETTCELDTTYYPFDEQRCSVEMYIYGYYGRLKFRSFLFDEIHLLSYRGEGTWNVTDHYISNQNGPNVTVTYHLKRNPRYMIINFLVPLLVLALLNPLVFLLPANSGERIGYSVTILLALSVYMTLLGDYLPQNSDPIPLITYTIMIWYILGAITVSVLFISARVYNRSIGKPIPRVLQVFVVIIRRLFCINCACRPPVSIDEDEAVAWLDERAEKGAEHKSEKVEEKVRVKNGTKLVNLTCHKAVSWHSVSKALDLSFMTFIYVVKIIFVVVFMTMLSQREKLERIIAKKRNFT